MQQGRLSSAQGQLGRVGTCIEHVDQKLLVAAERGFGERHDACVQFVQLSLQLVGPVVEKFIDMAQRALDLPHRVDRTLRYAQPHAVLQQDKRRADAAEERAHRVGNQYVRADEIIGQAHGPGVGAYHRRKRRAVAQLDTRRVAADQEHDFGFGAFTTGFNICHRAEVMVRPQVADPRQRAVDDTAAIDRARMQQKVSMPARLFIGLDMPVAPKVSPRLCRASRSPISAELPDCSMYTPHTSWHQTMKPVAPPTRDTSLIV